MVLKKLCSTVVTYQDCSEHKIERSGPILHINYSGRREEQLEPELLYSMAL